jgi:hypothetical protein
MDQDFNDDYGGDFQNILPPHPSATPVALAPTLKVPELKIKSLQSAKPISASKAKFLPKFEKIEKELATVVSIAPSNNKKWKDLKDSVNVVSESTTAAAPSGEAENANLLRSKSDVLEDDGSMYMFWFDAFEKSGGIYLFGKVFLF